MRHVNKGRKFGRKRSQRKAFVSSLAANLVIRESMRTTDARARELRPVVEKFVTLAKKQNLPALRLLMARLPRKAALRLFYEVAPRYKDRHGGYVRIIKTAKRRQRDGSEMAKIEFVK